MTDNEIIKALEHCASGTGSDACNGCPFDISNECTNNGNAIYEHSLDLINRQKAEIERQKEYCSKCAERTTKAMIGLQETLGTARAEAIKEFAERLKERAYLDGAVSITQEMVVDVRDVDDLVEEMAVKYGSSKDDTERKDEGK